jgi:hypothetical protein
MRQLILLTSVFVMMACGTQGNRETPASSKTHWAIGQIDDILHDGNYTIKWEFQGCFGGGKEELEVTDRKKATYTFLDYSQKGGPERKTRPISWTLEKEVKLKEIFELGWSLQDSLALCTTTTKYVLTSRSNSIDFKDLNCEVTEKFEELAK